MNYLLLFSHTVYLDSWVVFYMTRHLLASYGHLHVLLQLIPSKNKSLPPLLYSYNPSDQSEQCYCSRGCERQDISRSRGSV